MDSFPMLKRCWERQWAGLGQQQWSLETVPFEVRGVMGRAAYSTETALWTAARPLKGSRSKTLVNMILMSLKEDHYGAH